MEQQSNGFISKVGNGIKKGFVNLISWIKETAWIQPLLIVSVIFAIILGIKPFISWVGGIFNPDESYAYYKTRTIDDMDHLYDNYVKGKDGTVIAVFYSEDDTASANVEKTIKNYAASNEDITFWCIDVIDHSKDADTKEKNQKAINDKFQLLADEYYAVAYNKMPSDMKSSDYSTFKYSDDDTTNFKIPTPLFVRYDKGNQEPVGVRIGLGSSAYTEALDLFAKGSQAEWEKGKLNN